MSNYDSAMQLPKGKTCASSVHAQRCVALGYSWLTRTRCDFYPSRFSLVRKAHGVLRGAHVAHRRAEVPMSPTELTLRQLRAEGYTARVVERWNHYAGIRQDLFGFDVLAVRNGLPCSAGDHVAPDICGIQACAAASHAARKTKLLANPEAARWICAGGRLEIWSWSTRRSEERTKAGKRSKRLVHHLRREEIKLSDFVPQQAFSEGTAVQAEQPREAIT